ncbi:hypothetical protein O7626_06915 [Micromonospora sp. WMMD1102]|uniref:hypothetical protein n=1 Tax=Micromonospora sp. WMMD1102 TaxID=3016105 RepID=UPI002415516F|nr:hypothetical protein [Micromonospora sp. WMMD1102]MDG4785663.1 hypothetical protein [Micromonospora sp. WMMD1102]
MVRAAGLVALAGVAGPLTGCGLFGGEPDPPPAPDPLAPLITGALDLAARYEAAVTAFPELADRLRPVAEAHRAHAAELARVTGTALPSASASAPTPGTGTPAGSSGQALGELREAERQGRDAAAKATAEAPASRAALVGSIAAARATHLEVLR